MTTLNTPIYLTHLNHDYNETTTATTCRVGAVMSLFGDLGVAIRHRDGVTEGDWERLTEIYGAGKWKGAAIYKIDRVDSSAEIAPEDEIIISPEEIGMTRITSHTDNGDGKAYVIARNVDYRETAIVCRDLDEVTTSLIRDMGISRDDLDAAGGSLQEAISEAYESGGWKGLSVIELDLKTTAVRKLDPSELPLDAARHFPGEEPTRP